MTERMKILPQLGDTSVYPVGQRFDNSSSPLDMQSNLIEGQQLSAALLYGRDSDQLITPCGAYATKRAFVGFVSAFGYTPETFARLKPGEQDKIITKIEHALLREMKKKGVNPITHDRARLLEADAIRRTALHKSLNEGWAKASLKLERPQGSSLHHLIRYDVQHSYGQLCSVIHEYGLQSFVVENDWGKLVPKSRGEWRLPFEKICWEFRISNVRVMVCTIASPDRTIMYMIYGRDKLWVADDYLYTLDQDGFKGQPHDNGVPDPKEFCAVASMVYANIRASCIMLDASVASGEKVEPSKELVKKATRENVAPPKTHYVVRLLRRNHVKHRSRGSGEGGGYRQGGHWRPGRWLHYDNQDSGQEKYINDGGFWVSKSWQPWHFAGDPNRIIEREYRL